MKGLAPGRASLRAHDLHQGLQAAGIDRSRGLVGEELAATQKVGMAAALATAIKGLDIVPDGAELRRIADQQFDIPSLLFGDVVRVLEETEFVRSVRRDASGRILSLYENVPEDFTRLYVTCDEVYKELGPGEVEQALVVVVDHLSGGPRPTNELDLPDLDLKEKVLQLGDAAEAIKTAGDRAILYSPYFSYENPEQVGAALQTMDVERVRHAIERIRANQGLPIVKGEEGATLAGLVGAGLVAGPGLLNPANELQSFAVAPYGLPPDLLITKKAVMDKALAV